VAPYFVSVSFTSQYFIFVSFASQYFISVSLASQTNLRYRITILSTNIVEYLLNLRQEKFLITMMKKKYITNLLINEE
jgi:hypothetical protein